LNHGYHVIVDFITVLSLVFSIIASLAAVMAAFYAKGSASKADLERVERNTAESVKHIDAVRTHLEERIRREALLARFDRVSMAVDARGPAGESVLLRFTLNDERIELLRADLLNADNMQSGSFSCSPTDEPSCFVTTVDHDTVRSWFGAGTDTNDGKRVQIRAHLRLHDHEAARNMSAGLNLIRQEKQTVWTLSGKC
jgi:hypothetical protein